MKSPAIACAIASPLYTAPLAELSTTTNAFVPPDQPEMVPSSLSNRKRAMPCAGMTNPVPPLNTIPVGEPGTFTVSGTLAPVFPLYRVDLPVPLSATHHGEVLLAASPQAFTRAGSVTGAGTAPSETRLCWTY